MEDREKNMAELLEEEARGDHEKHKTPGAMVLTLILLIAFAVYYFANWKALADVWPVR